MPKKKRPAALPKEAQRFGPHSAWYLVLVAVAGAAFFFARQRPEQNRARAPAGPGNIAPAVEPEAQAYAGYRGSASCRECHAEAYDLWAASHHGHAERPPRAELDGEAFDPLRTFRHGTQTTSVRLAGSHFQIATVGLSRQPETQIVARVIGHDPLRQYLVAGDGGRFQTMEASYDPLRQEWFNVYGQEDRQPGEWGHWTGRGMNWNDMCAGCHNTRVRKNYDPTSDRYHTTMAETTVGCEACHGPLGAHDEWQHRLGKSGRPDPTIRKLSRQRVMDNCGSCHARRSELTGDFKPGDDFLDEHELTIVEQPDGRVREALQRRLDDPVRAVRLSAAWSLRATVDPGSTVGRELDYYLNHHADQPVGQLQLGHYWLARGQLEQALAHLRRAVQWDANSAPFRHELAVALSTGGRAREAVEQLEAACRLEPREAEYRYKLGLAWNELGDQKRTINALEEAVRLAPRHARALYNLGLAYHARGEAERALQTLNRAEAAAPGDQGVPYAQATILAQLGRKTEARAAVERALEIQPDFAQARELLRQLR